MARNKERTKLTLSYKPSTLIASLGTAYIPLSSSITISLLGLPSSSRAASATIFTTIFTSTSTTAFIASFIAF